MKTETEIEKLLETLEKHLDKAQRQYDADLEVLQNACNLKDDAMTWFTSYKFLDQEPDERTDREIEAMLEAYEHCCQDYEDAKQKVAVDKVELQGIKKSVNAIKYVLDIQVEKE